MTFRAFYHADQQRHDPQQFMRAGRIAAPQDVPARTDSLLAGVHAAGLELQTPTHDDLGPLLGVHTSPYLEFLSTAYERWREIPNAGPEVLPNVFPYWNASPESDSRPPCPATSIIARAGYYLGDLAVPIGPHTWRSSRTSAMSAVAAADAVMGGDRVAYALCRPSGHHARSDRASGFCYLNNTAIAATRLRGAFGRVAVIDVDAHHGDGTQTIFYRRSDVVTISIHADPTTYYPFFTGYPREVGFGEGEGLNLNLPLPPGSGDAAFAEGVARAVDVARSVGAEALVIALGFDAHRDDPIGILAVSNEGFGQIGGILDGANLPTVVIQEGGYHVPVLGECLHRFLAAFAPAG